MAIHFMALSVVAERKISDKRHKIIQAAIHVFSQHGFYNSTVADVANEAGVADGTIYLYFKNKDDLLISVFEHSMDMFISMGREDLARVSNPGEKLKLFIDLHLKLVQKNQNLAQVIQIELRQSSKFMKEYANEKFFEYLKILEDILVQGQTEGLFKTGLSSAILKRAIFGAIDEMALEWVLMRRKRYTLEEASEQLSEFFLHGLMVH